MSARVFIASTYLDNETRRALVRDAIITSGLIPVGMEWMGASTQPPLEECLAAVRTCRLSIIILAHRYGWIPPGCKQSITELEYEASADRLVFLLSNSVKVDYRTDFDDGPERWRKQELLDAFRARTQKAHTTAEFTESTLGMLVLEGLRNWKARNGLLDSDPRAAQNPLTAGDVEIYGRRLRAVHDTLPIVGFSRTQVRIPIRLDELYVPLRVLIDKRLTAQADYDDAIDALRKIGTEQPEVSLAEAFPLAAENGQRGIVILGDPGSGKTTQLKRLLIAVLQEGGTFLGLKPDTLPILLSLRDLAAGDTDLDALVARTLDSKELGLPSGIGQRLLGRGGLLLLIDGLDEVPGGNKRAAVSRWIENALERFDDCRIVVSCRYAGYTERARLDKHFLELHLRPLSTEQAEEFIRRWFEVVESKLADDPELARMRGLARAQQLINRIAEPDFRARRVHELIRNPLLLTAICLVHRDRGELPKRRVDLYAFCVDVLLERWHSRGFRAHISPERARRALEPMAYFMHMQEGRVRATAHELEPVIAPSIGEKGDRPSARAFLEAIRDDSGLVTGWSGETFGFLHLGFQEFLAARAIKASHVGGGDALSRLATQLESSWWQEVTLLALALDEGGLFDAYLGWLCRDQAIAGVNARPELLRFIAMAFDDAARPSCTALVDLLRPDRRHKKRWYWKLLGVPRSVTLLWDRQLAALGILLRVDRDQLRPVLSHLRQHPDARIARRVGEELLAGALESEELGILSSSHEESRVLVSRDEKTRVSFQRIPAGAFEMGGTLPSEGPLHHVAIDTFDLATTVITNEQYGIYLQENPQVRIPQYWADRERNQPRQPVTGVSWYEARAYCEWAGYRLPSEAEWEYACRAGAENDVVVQGPMASTEVELTDLGQVGERRNPWGLQDMHGDVWEWCQDAYHDSYAGAPCDGSAWEDEAAVNGVVRGVNYGDVGRRVTGAARFGPQRSLQWSRFGFRPARNVKADHGR